MSGLRWRSGCLGTGVEGRLHCGWGRGVSFHWVRNGFLNPHPFRISGFATSQPVAKLKRYVVIERAGVGLLIGDTQLRQHIQDDAGLDFEFSSQLVDPNFTHTRNPETNTSLRGL